MVGLFCVLYIGLVKKGFIERKLGEGNIRSGSVQVISSIIAYSQHFIYEEGS